MSDHLLTSPDRQESLSRAYVQAVAASAGYVIATTDFDRDGIDVEIKAGGAMRPAIGLQLKATINLGSVVDGVFRFPLKRHNYDLLRMTTQTPRLLIVLDMPRKEDTWAIVKAEMLIIRRCAFWVSLANEPETDNEASVTVAVPATQQFDVAALRLLMHKSRLGFAL